MFCGAIPAALVNRGDRIRMNRILMGVFIFLCSKGNAAERPPQYVALAFDNCAEVSRWDNLNQFSEEMKNLGKPVHFTFFVSGTRACFEFG